MKETSLYIKYDGALATYKKHQIDAKELASSLGNLADLIYEANLLLNGIDSPVTVNAQAGFIKGSFGLELVVGQDPTATYEILRYLGLIGAGGLSGTLFSVLLKLQSKKATDIEINEETGEASIIVGHGDDAMTIPAPKEVVALMREPAIRKRVEKVIKTPLESEGTGSFQVLPSQDDVDEPIFVVEKDEGSFFKAPATPKPDETLESDTVATIEFIQTNKDSGTSGWRINHLGEEVAVKVVDEMFLVSIKRSDAPSIYGLKYKVELHVNTIKRSGNPDKKTYRIDKVLSTVRGS